MTARVEAMLAAEAIAEGSLLPFDGPISIRVNGEPRVLARGAQIATLTLNRPDAANALNRTLFRESVDEGGPRPATEYWSTIVNAMLSKWHPQESVSEDTPAETADFLEKVLNGESLV